MGKKQTICCEHLQSAVAGPDNRAGLFTFSMFPVAFQLKQAHAHTLVAFATSVAPCAGAVHGPACEGCGDENECACAYKCDHQAVASRKNCKTTLNITVTATLQPFSLFKLPD